MNWRTPNRRAWLRLLIREPAQIRFYQRWHASQRPGRSPLDDRWPWITFGAAAWLAARLTPTMRVFEWGSGGSTLFFAARVHTLVSVEHDPAWFQTVSAAIGSLPRSNVSYSLHEPRQGNAPETHARYQSTDMRYTGLVFDRYVHAIDAFSDSFFDLIFVDGRARNGCMEQARQKLRPGGLLVLDNSEREEYGQGRAAVAGWPGRIFSGPGPYGITFWSTTIWRRLDAD